MITAVTDGLRQMDQILIQDSTNILVMKHGHHSTGLAVHTVGPNWVKVQSYEAFQKRPFLAKQYLVGSLSEMYRK